MLMMPIQNIVDKWEHQAHNRGEASPIKFRIGDSSPQKFSDFRHESQSSFDYSRFRMNQGMNREISRSSLCSSPGRKNSTTYRKKGFTEMIIDMKIIENIENQLSDESSDGTGSKSMANEANQLKEKLKEIKYQKHLIRSNYTKVNGIDADKVEEMDLVLSIKETDYDVRQQDNNDDQKDHQKSWTDCLIVSK